MNNIGNNSFLGNKFALISTVIFAIGIIGLLFYGFYKKQSKPKQEEYISNINTKAVFIGEKADPVDPPLGKVGTHHVYLGIAQGKSITTGSENTRIGTPDMWLK